MSFSHQDCFRIIAKEGTTLGTDKMGHEVIAVDIYGNEISQDGHSRCRNFIGNDKEMLEAWRTTEFGCVSDVPPTSYATAYKTFADKGLYLYKYISPFRNKWDDEWYMGYFCTEERINIIKKDVMHLLSDIGYEVGRVNVHFIDEEGERDTDVFWSYEVKKAFVDINWDNVGSIEIAHCVYD